MASTDTAEATLEVKCPACRKPMKINEIIERPTGDFVPDTTDDDGAAIPERRPETEITSVHAECNECGVDVGLHQTRAGVPPKGWPE